MITLTYLQVNAVKHRVQLTDDKPFKQKFRRIPPGTYQELKQHLKQMLDCGVIRESHSSWASESGHLDEHIIFEGSPI